MIPVSTLFRHVSTQRRARRKDASQAATGKHGLAISPPASSDLAGETAGTKVTDAWDSIHQKNNRLQQANEPSGSVSKLKIRS